MICYELQFVGGWWRGYWLTHLRSWENKILSERKISSVQISNFRASSREEPSHGEERNSEVRRVSEQYQSLSSHFLPAGAQRRPTCQWMILDPDSYQPRPSLSLLTSPILYFPPSNSTNIVLLEFYIKPNRREENTFLFRNFSFSYFYISQQTHWERKGDKVHISLGWSEDRNISYFTVVKSSQVNLGGFHLTINDSVTEYLAVQLLTLPF